MDRNRKTRGFSIIELVVVGGILLLLAAIATPTITRSFKTYRLGSSATEVANILQRTRFEAIKRNTSVTWRGAQISGLWNLWIDTNNNGNLDATEPVIILPRDMQFLTGSQVPSPSSMGYGTTREIAGVVIFDGRGAVSFGGAAPAVLVIYLGVPRQPTFGFRAITLLPNGRTKVWKSVQGGTWSDR